MARKRDDTIKLVLRLPPALHRQLTRIATRNNQSLNSEMIHRLEESIALAERQEAILSSGTTPEELIINVIARAEDAILKLKDLERWRKERFAALAEAEKKELEKGLAHLAAQAEKVRKK